VNSRFVTDTMAVILRLEGRKLSQKIKAIFENAENGKGKLIIPVMVLAEIGYLSEKERIETNLNEVKDYSLKYESIEIEPITEEIIVKTFEINDIPELHDRIIAGTAFQKGLKLITNDPIISDSSFVKVIW